ncbi:MAG TPA: PQQ-binding-like beta-propeller repeat protein [Caulobacteraceae bacterium]|nr:PQQ-binding-like beta-propeller repeat protein [Caulobacteraceae bacterium]
MIPAWLVAMLAAPLLAGLAVAAAPQRAAPPGPAAAAALGKRLFETRCASCHEPAVGRAPDRARLSQLGLLEIFNELKNGSMQAMAKGLDDQQLGAIAYYLAPPAKTPVAAAAPPGDPPRCATRRRFALHASDWPNWGRGLANRRWQPRPGFAPADVTRLKVKWAFAEPGGKYGQPTVAGGRLFLTSAGGAVYALDAGTGCMDWRFDGARSRTTVVVGRLAASPSGYAAFVGGLDDVVHALDAVDGKPIWSTKVETHPLAILTGAPVLYGGRLYVPLSSYEELTASQPSYPCCSFRGGVAALDAASGKLLWKTHAIAARPAPSHKNGAGTQMQGPAGAAVWSAPTIDARLGLLFVATGDSYTDVKQRGADAIVAMDLATGKVRWKTQVTRNDNYLSGCTPERPLVNCPNPLGHDFDFGASPVLVELPGGGDMLIAGQKSGMVYGLSPADGKILWRTRVGAGGPLGGIEWGMASDGKRLYVANADAFMPSPPGKPGLAALDPANGKELWFTPSPHLACGWTGGAPCMNGVSAPPTAIPGVVIAGDLDGRLRAYAADDGRILWDLDTGARSYRTINGVAAQPGGNIDGPGPVAADGMLYVYSGYLGSLGGASTNALLAFSVGGR